MNEILYSVSNPSILQIILSISLLSSAIMVNLAVNPVESVLFLVLTFITSGILLMTFLSEFFGITVIIIYVGAIAVLFLFVIMMLNVKSYPETGTQTDSFLYPKRLYKFCLLSSILYFVYVIINYKTNDVFSYTTLTNNLYLVDQLDNIQVLGQVLYNYYLECFLIAGLLLLVALLGSVVLTLSFSNTKKGQQLPNRQLARSDKFLSFFN